MNLDAYEPAATVPIAAAALVAVAVCCTADVFAIVDDLTFATAVWFVTADDFAAAAVLVVDDAVDSYGRLGVRLILDLLADATGCGGTMRGGGGGGEYCDDVGAVLRAGVP